VRGLAKPVLSIMRREESPAHAGRAPFRIQALGIVDEEIYGARRRGGTWQVGFPPPSVSPASLAAILRARSGDTRLDRCACLLNYSALEGAFPQVCQLLASNLLSESDYFRWIESATQDS
jgi:hypothetical protein